MSYANHTVKQLTDERDMLRSQIALHYQRFKVGTKVNVTDMEKWFDQLMEVQSELLAKRKPVTPTEQ